MPCALLRFTEWPRMDGGHTCLTGLGPLRSSRGNAQSLLGPFAPEAAVNCAGGRMPCQGWRSDPKVVVVFEFGVSVCVHISVIGKQR